MKNKPFKFTKHIDVPNENKNSKNGHLLLKFSIVFCLISYLSFTTYEFVMTHDFKSPVEIKFSNPIPRKEIKIESPVGSRSGGLVNQVYAEEIKNPYESNSPKGIAWEVNKEVFGVEHWGSLEELIQRESTWNPYAVNSSSGACGLGQALPCSKMDCEKWDYECQVRWIANYIDNRYGTPTEALAFHDEKNWY